MNTQLTLISTLPNAQTSVALLNFLVEMTSGADHLETKISPILETATNNKDLPDWKLCIVCGIVLC
jgi:hypothetical protein